MLLGIDVFKRLVKRSVGIAFAIVAVVSAVFSTGTFAEEGDKNWWDGFDANGVDSLGAVSAMTVYRGDLIVGGGFEEAGGTYVAYIARWDGSQWHSMAGGMDAPVLALGVYRDTLFAGGTFGSAGEVLANYIARWDGVNWRRVESGIADSQGQGERTSEVHDMTVLGDSLYVCGRFPGAEFLSSPNVIRWNGIEWSSVGNGLTRPLYTGPGTVYAVEKFGSNLVAAGRFNREGGGEVVPFVGVWDGIEWLPLGGGTSTYAYALAAQGDNLYVGGQFTEAGGVPVNYVAKWFNGEWHPLGEGLNGHVMSLTIHEGKLIAGGRFTEAGGEPALNIALWNGVSWSPLGSGIDDAFEASVDVLVSHGGAIFVGGAFDLAGQETSHNIARWGEFTVPVVLSYLTAERIGADGLIRWGVASQTYHAGFHIHRQIEGWPRFQITDDLLAGERFYTFVDRSAPRGPADYWLRALDTDGEYAWHGPVRLAPAADGALRLDPNRPNPFNPQTTLSFSLPIDGEARLAVYDVAGRHIATLVDGPLVAGEHTASWDGRRDDGTPVASGTYVARLEAGGEERTFKVVLAK